MSYEQLFDLWAPAESVWSPWAKPVLFAERGPQPLGEDAMQWQQHDVTWAPNVADRLAIVLDVTGRLSVELGLALGEVGYRPVPLFNTCHGTNAVVNVESLCGALYTGASVIQNLRIERDAPPVFLLDAARMREGAVASADSSEQTKVTLKLKPGDFDNRWMVFPQDFPSANFLLAHHIPKVLLVQERRERPADDVAHVLRRWQDAGITIHAKNLANESAPAHIEVPRPRFYRATWLRFLTLLGLRRNAAGGFGAVVPHPSSGVG